MPSEADLKGFQRMQDSVGVDDTQRLVANMPPYPPSLKKLVPDIQQHENELKGWIKELIIALRGGPV